jgi:hypothetical protein
MMVRPACLALLTCTTLVACGDDAGDAGDSSSDTGVGTTAADDDETGPPDPTTDVDDDTTTTTVDPDTTVPGDTSDTGHDTGHDTGDTGDTGDTEDPTGEPSPYDGEPLPPADDGEWTWVDFPEALCRDGSSTGIGVRYGSGDGLVIYFEGGGACFNGATCALNPSNYGAGNFNGFAGGGGNQNFFSTDAGMNPVGDWSFVYVPYCTGDVHAGAKPDGTLPDVGGTQQFVGYLNVGHFLDRVVPTFLPEVQHVVVAGQSAGGFGAAFNYDRIADAFPELPVTLLDDSGPPLGDEVMAPCLQQQWRDAWNLDDSMPADCAECFGADGGGIIHLATYLGEKHTGQRLALISSLADNTIRFFFGFGANDCNTLFPDTPADEFEAGLYELRDNHLQAPEGAWGTFYIDSSQHTWLGSSGYFNQTVDGVKMIDWVADLIAGNTAHVSP